MTQPAASNQATDLTNYLTKQHLYRREIELADKIITVTALETPPAWWPDFFPPSFHLDNLRQVLLHVIAETATHAGHLDAARELIDGQTWLILT